MSVHNPSLDSSAKATFDSFLKQAVESRTVPAIHIGAANADEILYFNCAGERVFGEPDEGMVDDDTILQLYSMTKLVTTAAVLHAMDQGLITSLDDSELVEKVCPDLCQLKILEGFDLAGKAVLVPRKNPITLKLLLSHTAGLAYEFTSSALTRWVKDNNHPAIFDAGVEAFLLPLTYEPGTRFRYSIGVDWAGILLERVSGKSLEDYFLENLFKPYGIKSLTFRRPANLEAKLQAMCTRERPHWGKIIVGGGARNLDKIPEHCMGGGGLFGTVTDYLRFLQTLLKCPSGKGPLKPETYKVLFKPAFPPLDVNNSCHEDMARFAMGQTWHDTTQARAWLYEYSTGLCINARDSIYGRKAGSGCWDGAAKSMYWIDPSTGVAGVCCTQLLSASPDLFLIKYNEFERLLYDHLEVKS